MSEGKLNGANMRLKRNTNDEDKTIKDEPPYKSQRLYSPFNDDQFSQGPFVDTQFECSEITEHNYKKVIATSLYKKLQILETHDRILRATTTQLTKELNVDEIKPMEGTCLDMCPEKERLLRIHGNMVSQFECKMIDFKLEPVYEIMVKQYARSSADQANPLSHELRPVPVLVKTMNYMLRNIIYPIESNIEQDLASWYDFCWDRLRAIRKDIVQQNLKNPEVVTILEQIGRFHIACYDLMLGYPGFDIKLNTENLNNCIQMLMPMYRDSEQPCPNEPEFVSYELLMHIGNPQFHTAYDLLPVRIKQSPQVRFCILAHTTFLQSSDCIEFFNLLKSTSFMNCCILQRVIPSIRYNNIKMMNMSYTTVKRIYKLDMKHFMEKLCFEDIQSAKEFCSDIQLKCDDMFVELSRKITIRVPEHRSQKQELIITKKRKNLTFLISGVKYLPNVIISPIHSSFDDNDCFNDPTSNELNEDTVEIENTEMEMDSSSNSKDGFSNISKYDQSFSKTQVQTPVFEVSSFTFKLPKSPLSTPVETSPFSAEMSCNPPLKTFIRHDDSSLNQSNLSTSSHVVNSFSKLPATVSHDLFIKPPQSPLYLNPLQSSYKIHFKEKLHFVQLTEKETNLAKKYFYKWQNFVSLKKSKYIEEVFAHSELFNSECISSLSSSPSSVKSLNYFNDFDILEESREWQHKQYILAEKYFYIWLRKVLRKRRKIEIDPVNGMPWSVFMQVHGTPKETLQSIRCHSVTKEGKRNIKGPISYPLHLNKLEADDISNQIADIFVQNVIDEKKYEIIGNKVFWKLAVNYGDSPEPTLENKVQTIIYGKIGFSNNQVQTIHTSHNTYFIKSVQSYAGLNDWTRSGLNAALFFTNTSKEDIETLFKRVESILQSTPTAIPVVMIFSSSSNKNEIENYQTVLDAYRENDYINNYTVYVWEGPKTILEAIEFFSKNYVDITPKMRSENLFYNLLRFAQTFYLKVRNLLPEDNPNTIIEKYNQYLNAYIKRLGRNNDILRDVAPEFVPYYTQNPEKFSIDNSNMNLKCFEDILNGAYLLPYKSWPPEEIDDLIDYVKDMCQLTNRRSWCLDMLQLLQLHRKADLDYCLLNGNWYEVIEMWIEGALEKCSATREHYTVFYNGEPITDVLKIVFPDD